jgi:hypothetical protein
MAPKEAVCSSPQWLPRQARDGAFVSAGSSGILRDLSNQPVSAQALGQVELTPLQALSHEDGLPRDPDDPAPCDKIREGLATIKWYLENIPDITKAAEEVGLYQ